MNWDEYKGMTNEERMVHFRSLPAKRLRVWELHSQGLTFAEIAKEMGLPRPQTAHRYFHRYHQNLCKETQTQMKDSLLTELRRIQSTNNEPKIKLAAIDRIMKLFGLDKTNVDITSDGQSLVKFVNGWKDSDI